VNDVNPHKPRKLIGKLFVFYLITLLLTPILGVGQEFLKISYDRIAIPQMAPALAFVITTILFPSLKTRLNFQFDKHVFLRLWQAIFIPFGLIVICYFGCGLIDLTFEPTTNLITALPLSIGGMVFGSMGEEIGWRGFLQPSLEKKYAKFPTALLVGFFWGLWHMGNYQYGWVFMAGFLLFTMSASILLRIVLHGTNNHMVLSILFHLSINLGFYIFFKNALTEATMIVANGIVWAFAAFVLWMTSKKKQRGLV